MKNLPYRHAWILLFFALTLLFVALPQIDLRTSALFFRTADGFFWQDTLIPRAFYRTINELEHVLLYGLMVLFVVSLTRLHHRLRANRARLGYLLVVLLLGPGLLVNGLLKNEVGRARPSDVIQFGGEHQFTRAFLPAQECSRNCAFVSGHAALGFYPVAVGFAFPRRRRAWLVGGIGFGALAGLMRIIQGKHYLSDVVFAFFAIYAIAVITYHAFRHMGWLPPLETANKDAAPAANSATDH